jgi:hypothetical protein
MRADDGRPSPPCPQSSSEQRVAAELRSADDKLMITHVLGRYSSFVQQREHQRPPAKTLIDIEILALISVLFLIVASPS